MNKEEFVQLVSERRRKGDLTRGRAIHARCVDCVCYNVYAVAKCKERACARVGVPFRIEGKALSGGRSHSF